MVVRFLAVLLAIAATAHAQSPPAATEQQSSPDYLTLRTEAEAASSKRDYATARLLYRQAIDQRIATDGRYNPALIRDYFALALLYRSGEEQKEGLRALDRASEIVLRAPRLDPLALADVHSLRGVLLLSMKEIPAAVSVLQTALTLREETYGPDHASLLPDLDRLASAYVMQREYEMSEASARRAVTIRERVLGPEDPDLLSMLDILAYSLYGQKRYGEAETVYLRLVALWENSAGSHHPMLALTLEKLAALYRSSGKTDDSREAAGRALAIRVHFLASGLVRQGAEELAAGRPHAALRLYREALAALKPDHASLSEIRAQILQQIRQLQSSLPSKNPKRRD